MWLVAAALSFAIGQIFQYLVSVHICNGTNGHINGGFFQVLFNLFAVGFIWKCWSSIVEEDWPRPENGASSDNLHGGYVEEKKY